MKSSSTRKAVWSNEALWGVTKNNVTNFFFFLKQTQQNTAIQMKVVVFQVISVGCYPAVPRCSNMCKIHFREWLAKSCSHCFAFCLSFIQHVLDAFCVPSALQALGTERQGRRNLIECLMEEALRGQWKKLGWPGFESQFCLCRLCNLRQLS